MRNLRTVGSSYEERASAFLSEQGFTILEQNFRTRFGEIDLIAREWVEENGRKKPCLCFIEVKYRGSGHSGTPFEAVNQKKQVRISNAALFYLMKQQISTDSMIRFDVLGIPPDGKMVLIRNAFPYAGR